jgi:hypothetical protein
MPRNDRLEDRIRDFLVDHLDVIESGLVLEQKEYAIPNPAGAGGRIDILARDRFNHFVIIEIKRSDQAARQALHEIHKYTALFRIQQGLDERQLRLLVISTDWHELRVPWSECVDSFPYSVEGMSIRAESDGTVTHIERVQPIPRAAAIEISRVQQAYLFESKSKRDGCASQLAEAATASGLCDFAIFEMNYTGRNPMVCFPFGLYLVFSSPLRNGDPREIEKIKASIEWDDTLEQLEENFLVAINKRVIGIPDDFEIGYPEKLTNIRVGWSIKVLRREGRLAKPPSLYKDEDLLALAQAVEGGSPIYICRMVSPKHRPSWTRTCRDLLPVLKGMPHWQRVVPRFLREVETNRSDSVVSIYVYNPANLSMAVYGLAHDDAQFCQMLEIVIEERHRKRVRVLFSALAWNGKVVSRRPEEIVMQAFGDIEHLIASMTFHETFVKEPVMLKLHHLDAPVAEITFYKGAEPKSVLIRSKRDGITREPLKGDFRDIGDFMQANADYIARFKQFIDSHSCGLAESDLFNRNRDD